MDQARVSEVDILVPILPQDTLNCCGRTRKLNRNLERAIRDILKNGFGGSRQASHQVTGLINDGFARD